LTVPQGVVLVPCHEDVIINTVLSGILGDCRGERGSEKKVKVAEEQNGIN
jgi:hypothetical protein